MQTPSKSKNLPEICYGYIPDGRNSRIVQPVIKNVPGQ